MFEWGGFGERFPRLLRGRDRRCGRFGRQLKRFEGEFGARPMLVSCGN